MSDARGLAVLGSTGSIGKSTLAVVREHPGMFQIVALAAGRRWEILLEQVREFHPRVVAVPGRAQAQALRDAIRPGDGCTVLEGPEGVAAVATADGARTVVAGITGAAGLLPVLAAIEAGRTVALANKETLVAAGQLVTGRARARDVSLVPVDSEHSAIFQCLKGESSSAIARLWLTASGGPFWTVGRDVLERVTPQMALRHPNWSMGAKITVDSSTLMNKGLEVIEAHWLFGVDYDRIDVVVHAQSIVHSAVEFIDGSIIAQMGVPDMKLPILYALSHPDRVPSAVVPRLDFGALGALTFQRPDTATFRCLPLAYWAGREGKTYPAALNAANEVAVGLFLESRLPYMAIAGLIEDVLEDHDPLDPTVLDDVLEADRRARQSAADLAGRRLTAACAPAEATGIGP